MSADKNALRELQKELKRVDVPQWVFDECESEEEYKRNTVALVESLYDQSKQTYLPLKRHWNEVVKQLELDGWDKNAAVTRSDVALLPTAVEEATSLMVETEPRPSASPRQDAQEQFASTLNYFLNQELDANEFASVLGEACYSQISMFLGCVKITGDRSMGLFGKPGKIYLRSIDPRNCWPDPAAKKMSWDAMRFFICTEVMDLTDVRNRWPGPGHEVGPDSYSVGTDIDVDAPLCGDGYVIGQRHRAMVKECWLKDDRLHFVPIEDPLTGEPMKDEDGKVLGEWKKRFPHGRVIIVANGVLLFDAANPYLHGGLPYVFFTDRPTQNKALSWSRAMALLPIANKINQLHKDMLRSARVGMNSPWIIDRHAFDSPKKFDLLTNSPAMVLPVTQGARVMRLPPTELPTYIWTLINWLRQLFDDILGVQAILRGQLQKGSQLSADSVEQLQVSSTSRIRFRARRFENSVKEIGHKACWLIRQFYDSDLTVEVTEPHTQKKTVYAWTPEAATADYAMEMEAGSSLPGAKESGAALIFKLWEWGLCDREYAIRGLKLAGADALIQRMQQREEELAKLGILADARTNKTGRAGRKNRSISV